MICVFVEDTQMLSQTKLWLINFAAAFVGSLIVFSGGMAGPALAQSPNYIASETIESPFGKLDFVNGYPTAETSQHLFDQRTFQRAIEVFQTHIAAVSMFNLRRGNAAIGGKEPWQITYFPRLMDSRSVWLTASSHTVYASTFLNLGRDSATVVEIPPKMLGIFDDMWMRWIVDVGPTGPDKGRGGRFLILPPDYKAKVPSGYFTATSRTSGVWLILRAELVDGKADVANELIRSKLRVYPLAKARNAPKTEFVDGSGVPANTVFSDDYSFFEDLAQLIQQEPIDAISPTERFYLASIGIEKGKPFDPDSHTTPILGMAARVGAAMARANSYTSTDPAKWIYPDRKWVTGLIGENCKFEENGYINIDRLAYFSYLATGNTPAMFSKLVGEGSQYLVTYVDAAGEFLDGAQSYTLKIPPKIPAKDWSVTVYSPESRSMLQNGTPFPAVSSYSKPEANPDGSIDLYFSPKVATGREHNSIKTVSGKGWFPIFRLYSPLEPFYKRTWKLNDLQPAG
jgi:hypothetical protein